MRSPGAGAETPERSYCWPPSSCEDRLLVLADLDGTLRGDVLPMVKLVRPLLPRYADKVLRREPWNARKLVHFLWDLAKLWALRTVHTEERRRYKHLFSELHHLAAAMLRGDALDAVRAKYRAELPRLGGLWHEGAVLLLERMTGSALVALVTGSEQVQTEECAALLAARGIDTAHIAVHGSLYRVDPATRRFTGGAEHLNVTLDGKRDVVRHVLGERAPRVLAAFGNSRPDRALFEAVEPGGLRVVVCPERVFQRRRASSFVLRKLAREGFRVCWSGEEYVVALSAPGAAVPVLATDPSFANVLESAALRARYGELLAPAPRAAALPSAPATRALLTDVPRPDSFRRSTRPGAWRLAACRSRRYHGCAERGGGNAQARRFVLGGPFRDRRLRGASAAPLSPSSPALPPALPPASPRDLDDSDRLLGA